MIASLKWLKRVVFGRLRYLILRLKFLNIRVGKAFSLRSKFYLGRGLKFHVGDNVFINRNVHVGCNVELGDDVLVAANVSFVGGDHRIDNIGDLKIKYSGREHKRSAIVKDNVWIGHGSIIFAGVTIESGAVIAAGAVVTQNVGQDEIVAGVPAKFVRKRKLGSS